jgi:hypothetical protein
MMLCDLMYLALLSSMRVLFAHLNMIVGMAFGFKGPVQRLTGICSLGR